MCQIKNQLKRFKKDIKFYQTHSWMIKSPMQEVKTLPLALLVDLLLFENVLVACFSWHLGE